MKNEDRTQAKRLRGAVPAAERRGRRARRSQRPALLTGEITRLLVMTNHIGVPQLGRMCRVSSSWRAAAMDDEAWANLCVRRWPNSTRVPRSILAAKGYRWLYRCRQQAILPPQLPPLAPPTLPVESLLLLVDITLDGTTQLSVALTGTELEPLFVKGTIDLPLSHPICLGEASLTANGQFEIPKKPDKLDWGATVHLMRTTDNKCVCLFSLDWVQWDDGYCLDDVPVGPLKEIEPPKPQYGCLDFNTDESGLDLTPQGTDMARHIKEFHGLFFKITGGVTQPRDAQYFGYRDMVAAFRAHYGSRPCSGAVFHAFKLHFWQDHGNGSNSDDPEDWSGDDEKLKQHFSKALAQPAEAKQLRVTEFSISTWQNDSSGTSDFRNGNCGVTLLHLLQELRAWERAD